MSELYDKTYNPDVLSCLANLSNDEVFTPPEVANQMLDMHQLKDRHGLIVSLVLSLAVYAQLPLLALNFCHGIQNESSSQREGGNKHERHG